MPNIFYLPIQVNSYNAKLKSVKYIAYVCISSQGQYFSQLITNIKKVEKVDRYIVYKKQYKLYITL